MALTKIVYFDKETINNILQERNKGSKTRACLKNKYCTNR